MKGDYVFPFHLALSELHPHILFSKSSKWTALLELTCPCEENMKKCWHSQKLNKYTPFAKVIKHNEWAVDFFAIEVGTSEYPSRLLSICIKGFKGKIVQRTTNSLSCIFMEDPIYIWLAKSSTGWSSNTSLITIDDAKFPESTFQHSFTEFTTNLKPKEVSSTTQHHDFFNKQSKCYANSVLLAFSVTPSFWCQSPSKLRFLSPLTRALTLNISLLKGLTTPLDPSKFLWALCRELWTNKQVLFQFDPPKIWHAIRLPINVWRIY